MSFQTRSLTAGAWRKEEVSRHPFALALPPPPDTVALNYLVIAVMAVVDCMRGGGEVGRVGRGAYNASLSESGLLISNCHCTALIISS